MNATVTARRFLQVSVFDRSLDPLGPFDAAVSRYVLHHVIDPAAFVARQVGAASPGRGPCRERPCHRSRPGVRRAIMQPSRVARDRTHTRNLTGGELVDLLAGAGLSDVSLVEDSFVLDFDEWFDRGTPGDTKPAVRERL